MNCTYCGLPGADRLVAIVHSKSGGGWARRAHSSCADTRRVKALDTRLPAEREAATARSSA
ncbi:hypothetical protein ACH492_34375 [Streptomyces sp. NPDC019443]|uniref:hypothetical protein n=1 Tax=Streptomyces sp. NPDC019443 TaxID=3365061 RepID=UPI00379D4F87